MFLNPAGGEGSVSVYTHRGFMRKVPLSIQAGDFVVKTAETEEELKSIFSLRYDVFHKEYRKTSEEGGLDIDQFDQQSDHLGVFDLKSGQAVGTYRLLSSHFCRQFYSQQEFVIQSILDFPGVKLELGRACISRSFRTGSVMRLLWTGLAAYVREINAEILFGCSSLKTTDPLEAAAAFKFLSDHGHMDQEFSVFAAQKYKMPGFQNALKSLESGDVIYCSKTAGQLIPSLLEGYLKAGGKVCGEPILDLDFQCVDFLTILKTKDLKQSFERRFRLC